jgi:hypothetical protein
MITESLIKIAEENTYGYDTQSLSELLEQESRRYSRRLDEEEEAKIR